MPGSSASHRTLLTADLGNTRCKLRLWHLEEPRPRRIAGTELPSAPGLGEAVASWARELAPLFAAHSSVALPALEHELEQALARICIQAFLGAVDPGVENACEEPATVGRDRLLAARGALELATGPVLVVDAGTALTVDAVERTASGGRFLGGAIAPGPALLADALARGGARLPRVEPRGCEPALGRHTRAAVQSGIVHGFRGAAAELLRRIAAESGLAGSAIVLTGGAAELLLEPPLWPRESLLWEPDLVHIGLCAAAGDALGRGRGAP